MKRSSSKLNDEAMRACIGYLMDAVASRPTFLMFFWSGQGSSLPDFSLPLPVLSRVYYCSTEGEIRSYHFKGIKGKGFVGEIFVFAAQEQPLLEVKLGGDCSIFSLLAEDFLLHTPP